MKESELTNSESLQIITDMIHQAKRNIAKKGSFYFLLWGWVVMVGNFGYYIIASYDLHHAPHIIWSITIPAAIVSIVYSMMQRKAATHTSQIDGVFSNLWMAIFASIVVVLIFMSKMEYNHNAIILLLSGLGTFVSGRLLKFNPLILGGLALWLSGIVAFNVNVVDQCLVGGIAIIVGYLIPGYLLKKAEGKN